MGSDRLGQLSGHKYIKLETYKKNGMGVATPVWFVIQDNRIIVVTRSETGKVKRLRNNGEVRIMPCGMMGAPKGEWMRGKGRFLNKEELDKALLARSEKYGLQAKLAGIFSSTKGGYTGISIMLDDSA